MKNGAPSVWRERLRSPLTWHYAALSVLVLLVLWLGIRLGMDWTATDSHSVDVLANKQVELKALRLETAPLRGLDKRVEKTREELKDFYERRIPPNYSSIATRIGDLQVKSGVRLSRIQYTQRPPGADLTEISMEAGISGDYPAVMRFINSIERDPMFFIIRAMALTGQRSGQVNLRIRISTWLRPEAAAASGLPTVREEDVPPLASSANAKEGQ
ncbi:MAG: hypothetical protein ACLGRW_04130 [Acidobacteriota bacterium]